jgi:hypothetical protein
MKRLALLVLPLLLLAGAAVLAGNQPPPTLVELNQTVFAVKIKLKGLDLADGDKISDGSLEEWAVTTWPDGQVLVETSEDDEIYGRYYDGTFWLGRVAWGAVGPVPQESATALFEVGGKEGKYKLKGQGVSFERAGNSGEAVVLKFSGKQIPD